MPSDSDQNVPLASGDIIDFASQAFRVLANYGHSGHVETWPDRKRSIDNFKWNRFGIVSRKIGYEMIVTSDSNAQ